MRKAGKEPAKTSPRKARKPAEKKRHAVAAAPKGLKKQHLKSGECRVTFMMPAEAAMEAESIAVVGDFNGWDPSATMMRRMKDGSFAVTLKLEAGKDYCFKYLIDSARWENDWAADRYEAGPFMSENSVVCLCGEH